ncbi:MAG TPA: N-acetylglucosamine-6-phosphate deacetylase [Vicinamibacterales bacterium]|nr:N-acetylglucosamine-6-phosphate deacetylase [Vicinamibacterales bacterium]
MIVLSGASLVLPDRILSPGTLVVDGDRIAEIRADAPAGGHSHSLFAFHGHYIVPGFIDVHVHGVEGFDSLDGGDAIASIAERLPRFGVTAFCPTTVACEPAALRGVLDQVRRARETRVASRARVLAAHLESNFINPEYAGAQPRTCLRSPRSASLSGERFSGADVLTEIERAAPDVGIVTVAPEVDGVMDLIPWLVSRGQRVSLGHSAATFDEATAAIAAGARHATHLFNRMPPLHHRAPGLAGAVLQAEEVAAEIICDGFHVHPALVRMAIAAKTPSRLFAITDATSVAGMAIGSRGRLGGQDITAGESTALLADGTLAGSTLTMDRAFRMLVDNGVPVVDAATMCSTTAARELGLVGHGILKEEAVADLVVLDSNFAVVQTYIAGQLVYSRNTAVPASV